MSSQNFGWNKFYEDMITKEDNEDYTGDHLHENCKQTLANLLTMVRKRAHKKRSLGKCFMDLGHGVKLAVSTYSFVQKANKLTKIRLTHSKNEEVKTKRQFLDPNLGTPLLSSGMN